MHHFPFHISDFSQATARLTPEQVGLYVQLLMEYYKNEKPLTDDLDELEFVTGVKSKSEKAGLRLVLKRFFQHCEAEKCYRHKRVDREIENYKRQCLQSLFAIVSRHWKKANPDLDAPTFEQFTASPNKYYDRDTKRIRIFTGRISLELESYDDTVTEPPFAEYQPISNNHDPISSTPKVPKGTEGRKPDGKALADAIYLLYPKKVGKGKALEAITKALARSKMTELEMQGHVRAYAEAVSRWPAEDNPRYVPNPATWFNQDRFLDDPATWVRVNPNPDFSAKKKEGGAAGDEAGVSRGTEAPEGWEAAMDALWGPGWPSIYAAWDLMRDADQRQVRAWLQKNKGGGAG